MISPNNPTGSVVKVAELRALASLAQQHDLALISDEVFADYSIAGAECPSALAIRGRADVCAGRAVQDRRVTPGEAGMDRREWSCCSRGATRWSRLETICDAYLSVSTPVQVAAPELLKTGAQVRAQIQRRVRNNFDGTRRRSRQRSLPARCFLSRPAGMRSSRCRRSASEEALVLDLLERTGILVHPGYFFDFEREAFLVVSLLPEPAVVLIGAADALPRDRPASMIQRSRRSGISVPLFSLRSSRSWGIGEIGDIPAAASWLRSGPSVSASDSSAERACALRGVSVLGVERDGHRSAVHQHLDAGGHDAVREGMGEPISRSSDDCPRIDYQKVRALKNRALKAAFERFFETEWLPETDQAASFQSYARREAWWLDEYSLYRALRSESGERPWMEWPARCPRSRSIGARAGARAIVDGDPLLQVSAVDRRRPMADSAARNGRRRDSR